jgi:hypothetical protein
MTKPEKVIKTKIGLLELGKQLGNVSKACQGAAYSRNDFYRFKELYETGMKPRWRRYHAGPTADQAGATG